jgi:hypothetical protein
MAVKQIGVQSEPGLIAQATTIVNDARRKLYQLLAEA